METQTRHQVVHGTCPVWQVVRTRGTSGRDHRQTGHGTSATVGRPAAHFAGPVTGRRPPHCHPSPPTPPAQTPTGSGQG